MRLTAIACNNLKPKAKPYKQYDGNGLYLEVMPNGNRLWRFKYKIHGKEKRISLGAYPEVSLLEAREKLQLERALVKEGHDPSAVRQEKKRVSTLQANDTFEAIAREWHEVRKSRWSKGHAFSILQRLENDAFPMLGKVPLSKITPPDVIACVRKIEKRGAHEMAKRVLQICGQVFRYGVQTGRLEHNFTPDLQGALIGHKPVSYAAIEPDELPDLVNAIRYNKARLFPQTILAMTLMLLTFVRTSELIQSKWSEFDLEKAEWVIPAERMKMRKQHIVPLSRQALAVLEQIKEYNGRRDYVFASIPRPRRPMSNCTILKGLERMGYKGRMTGHGFRALAMTTIKEKLGYRHEVVDRQLAHEPQSKIDRAYDRSKFLPERREMMQKWADYIDSVRN